MKTIKSSYKFLAIMLACVIAFCVGLFAGCSDDNEDGEVVFAPNVSAVGVWWWHTSANSGINPENIEFAAKNGVTEIYYATHSFSQRYSNFIKSASQKNIKVYLLLGDWEWIINDEPFNAVMSDYIEYQKNADADAKFAGVHIDVEPHQSPDFEVKRAELLRLYLDFVMHTMATYSDVHFDFDIPFWFTDEVLYKGKTVPLYEAVIAEADRIVIMSYRTTADKIYNLGTVPQQINFAASLNKQIFLSVECGDTDENITFAKKGRSEMYTELNKLKDLVQYDKLGIAIHHMRAWLELAD